MAISTSVFREKVATWVLRTLRGGKSETAPRLLADARKLPSPDKRYHSFSSSYRGGG